MVDLVYYLTNILFFGTPLLYYFINIRSSVNFLLFCGDIYLSIGIYLPNPVFPVSLSTVSKLFCCEVLETFVTLSAILLTIKSTVASDVF